MLSAPDDQPIYVIDAPSLVGIKQEPSAELVWKMVTRLIDEKRLMTMPQVMDELKIVDQDSYDRLIPYRRSFVLPIDRQRLLEAGRILQTNSCVTALYDLPDAAQTWLLAAAKVGGYVVVTFENNDTCELPSTCRQEGIKVIDFAEFMQREMQEVA